MFASTLIDNGRESGIGQQDGSNNSVSTIRVDLSSETTSILIGIRDDGIFMVKDFCADVALLALL